MTDEDGAQGIGDILDQIDDETPAAEATTEEVVEETMQPETEATATDEPTKPAIEQEPAESIEEAESQVAKLFDKAEVDHSGQTVPVEKHAALRKRAQDAEARADAAEAKQVNVDTGDALAELASLAEGGDDEYVDVAKLKQIIEKLPGAINSIAQANIDKVVQQASTQNLMQKIKTDEVAFRKDNADYQSITDFALTRNLISDAEKQAVFASPNAAEAMYKLANEKIAQERQILGVPSTAQPTTEKQPEGQPVTETDSEPLSDEEASKYFLNPSAY